MALLDLYSSGAYHLTFLVNKGEDSGSFNITHNMLVGAVALSGSYKGFGFSTPPAFSPDSLPLTAEFLAQLDKPCASLAQAREILLVGSCQVDIQPTDGSAGWGVDAYQDGSFAGLALKINGLALVRVTFRHSKSGNP